MSSTKETLKAIGLSNNVAGVWAEEFKRQMIDINIDHAQAAVRVFDSRVDEDDSKTESVNRYMRTIKIIKVEPSRHRQIIEVEVDVYNVLNAFKTSCSAMDHAAKKILAAGTRGYKDSLQDKREAIQSINRSIAMEKERMLLSKD
tara:strand:- start:2200 stop:2634 length:435 start_codon:yes stop_codon:yes gene_type:complete